MTYSGIEKAEKQTSSWDTPGPWLGMVMGFGTPLCVFVLNAAGWIAGLAAFGVMGAIAFAVIRRFPSENAARIYGSAALARYNTRFLLAMMAYIAGLLAAMFLYNNDMPTGPHAYAVPLLPTLPLLAAIGVMGRYMVEETDEYLRHRTSLSALIGLGLVLVVGTVWGFLETFALVPNIWAWWVFPVWAIGLGIGQGLLARFDRAAEKANDEDAHP